MPKKFDGLEDRVQEALRAYHDRDKPNMTKGRRNLAFLTSD